MPPLTLDTPLQYVKGVGPRKAEGLAEKGYQRVEDFLFHLPFRYEDRSRFATIESLRPGNRVTIRGRIISATLKRTRKRGFTIFEAVVDDDTAGIGIVFFNQPYLRDILKSGRDVILYGEVGISRYRGRALQMENPQYEILSHDGSEAIHTGRIVPIYQRVGDLSPRMVRVIMHNVLSALPEAIPDPLPETLREARGMMPRGEALRQAHFPPEDADIDTYQARTSGAHARLIFEEFFLLQLALGMRREGVEAEQRAEPYATTPEIREKLLSVLPFHLTGAQKRVFREIVDDLTSSRPMNRLLQGDVGSGKTIVALLAMLLAVENGRQAALMAPTEILAEQHARGMAALLSKGRYRIPSPDRSDDGRRAPSRPSRRRGWLHPDPRRNPRSDPGVRGVQEAGPGRDRRTAPVRRRAACRPPGKGPRRLLARRARDDRDAHPAVARADGVR